MYNRYAELITDKPVKRFLQKFCLSDEDFESLILISPWIDPLEGVRFTLAFVLDKVTNLRIPTYVITRKPEESWHRQAVDMLLGCNWVELRYNNSLHAKLYVCKEREGGFALLGSGNLSRASVEKNIEIGIMIYGKGRGKELLHELYYWGSVRLRSLPESKLVKRIRYERR